MWFTWKEQKVLDECGGTIALDTGLWLCMSCDRAIPFQSQLTYRGSEGQGKAGQKKFLLFFFLEKIRPAQLRDLLENSSFLFSDLLGPDSDIGHVLCQWRLSSILAVEFLQNLKGNACVLAGKWLYRGEEQRILWMEPQQLAVARGVQQGYE